MCTAWFCQENPNWVSPIRKVYSNFHEKYLPMYWVPCAEALSEDFLGFEGMFCVAFLLILPIHVFSIECLFDFLWKTISMRRCISGRGRIHLMIENAVLNFLLQKHTGSTDWCWRSLLQKFANISTTKLWFLSLVEYVFRFYNLTSLICSIYICVLMALYEHP